MLKKLLTVLAIVAICGVFMAGSAIAAPTIEKGQSFDTYLAELGATQMTTTELATVQGEALQFYVAYYAIIGATYACNSLVAAVNNPVWYMVKKEMKQRLYDALKKYYNNR